MLDIVLPIRVRRVEQAAVGNDKPTVSRGHEAGFQAGHEEGRLRAEWEAGQERKKENARVRALVQQLENLHREYETLIEQHLPDLIHGALARVYRKHAFTAEEISGEVISLLKDMEQASRIGLECAPAEEAELRRRLEECESIPNNSKWKLEANETLASGEFILTSDLGDVDGRHSSRLRQIHLAVEASL